MNTYIPLTLYPRRGNRGISDILPRHPRFTPKFNSYIHTYHSRLISKGVAEASRIVLRDTFYQNYFAMRTTKDVTGGKPVAVLLQCISGVTAINPSVAFYDIHGGKRDVLFFYFVPDATRESKLLINLNPFLPIRHRNFNPNLCLSVPIMYPHCELWLDIGLTSINSRR
jgi:hypothetical protein